MYHIGKPNHYNNKKPKSIATKAQNQKTELIKHKSIKKKKEKNNREKDV